MAVNSVNSGEMNLKNLVIRNLWYYRRPHFAVLSGIILSTAVLTGALIVGDSVRYSLMQIANKRLGNVQYAILPSDKLFRQDLSREIAEFSGLQTTPILQTEAIAICNEKQSRINRVTVIGIAQDFPQLWSKHQAEHPKDVLFNLFPALDEAVLNNNTASKLGVKPGDEILIRLHNIERISTNTPFTPEPTNPVALRLRIKAIANDEEMGRFSLKNEQSTPFNIFVNIHQLANRLHLDGQANGMLMANHGASGLHLTSSEIQRTLSVMDSLVRSTWQPSDVGLSINSLDQPNWFSITSRQLFINTTQSLAIKKAIPKALPILTYLVNTMQIRENTTPYSFVSAIDLTLLHQKLNPGEIIINQWLADDLKAKPGDTIHTSFWIMGPMRTFREKEASFRVKSITPIFAIPSARSLMPDFPGMADAGSCRDWETGSPIDLSKIRDKDEQYWSDYRGIPKAYISIEDGQKLWQNTFGSTTAFWFTAAADTISRVKTALMRTLTPSENGILFRPVNREGMVAASHSTDFGELFLGLSFFIIAAALLLMALLFSLHATSRMLEAGVLTAIGFRRWDIKKVLFFEALAIAVSGSIVGALAGILINKLMLSGLNTLWYDAVRTSSLVPNIRVTTLLTGAATGLVIATAVLALSLRKKLKASTVKLVKGIPDAPRKNGLRHPRNIVAVALLALGTFAVIVTGANRKSIADETSPDSGTGGFLLWAETTIPILKDLNVEAARVEYGLADDTNFSLVRFLPLQRLAGDDASCLNLNQIARPPLLGVPTNIFDSLQLFSFASTDTIVDNNHPWRALNCRENEGPIPVFADMTVIIWGLQKEIGDTLYFTGESGDQVLFKIVGGLNNSIFQGHLLMDEKQFRKLYPSVSGYEILLVSAPSSETIPIARRLEERFLDHGMMAIPATEKLASFNTVENTYLTVFLMLGGLGMVIGTIGLGIILWRNILERTRELSLLRAIGYPKRRILKRLVNEYLHILIAGLGAGVAASLLVLLPNFFNPGYHFPAFLVIGTLAFVFVSGLLWIIVPVRSALKKEILKGLRDE